MLASALLLTQLGCLVVSVSDASGRAIPGVRVDLVAPPPARPPSVTDAQGRARFCSLANGEYELRASLDGFRVQSVTARVGSSGESAVAMRLEEEPAAGGPFETLAAHRTHELDAKLQFEIAVQFWAGSGARDCGDLRRGPEERAALECARQALREKAAFFLFEPLRGIDSIVVQALASRGGEAYRIFHFDSLAAGADARANLKRIHQRPCPGPQLLDEATPKIVCPY